MITLQVNILNPKAGELLKTLADMKLISINKESKTTTEDPFIQAVQKIRTKAQKKPLSLNEITKEVEAARTQRYAKPKK